MLDSLFRQILLDLGGFEAEYQEFHIQSTIAIYKLTAVFVAVANLAMLSVDSLFLNGQTELLIWMILIRALYTAFTLTSLLVIQRPKTNHARIESVTFVWVLFTSIYFILFNFIRPSNHLTTSIDVLLVFGIYVLAPLRMNRLVALTVSFSIGSVAVAFLIKTDVSLIDRGIMLCIHIFVQLIGLASALQIQSYRRTAFLAYRQEKEARELALNMLRIDSMTRCLTRQYFLETAEQEFERARRYAHPLSALMMDIDHFKSVNDQYGHRVGDETLKRFSELVLARKRQSDLLGRLGGEEFALLLPETDIVEAELVARRIQEGWAETQVQVSALIVKSTVSIGGTAISPADQVFEDVLIRADETMYKAKQNGRNRVEVTRVDP